MGEEGEEGLDRPQLEGPRQMGEGDIPSLFSVRGREGVPPPLGPKPHPDSTERACKGSSLLLLLRRRPILTDRVVLLLSLLYTKTNMSLLTLSPARCSRAK